VNVVGAGAAVAGAAEAFELEFEAFPLAAVVLALTDLVELPLEAFEVTEPVTPPVCAGVLKG